MLGKIPQLSRNFCKGNHKKKREKSGQADRLGGGECQSLSVTFTLRTSLLDVLGRPYMMSCKVF